MQREIDCSYHVGPIRAIDNICLRGHDDRVPRDCVDPELTSRSFVIHIIETVPQTSPRKQMRRVKAFSEDGGKTRGQMGELLFSCREVATLFLVGEAIV